LRVSVDFVLGGLKKEMPTCPHCGATVPEGAVYCGNCGATLNAPMTSTSSTVQSQTSQTSTGWPNTPDLTSGNLQPRYEKAIKRTEQLAYLVTILGVVILVLLIAFTLF
jgi:uncharacterized membrane protein YvbJ